MGAKLSDIDNKLYKAIDEVLHYVWDPIGVSGNPAARDEYYGYIPGVFKLLKSDECSEEKIANELNGIIMDSMGMPANLNLCRYAASALISWREYLLSEFKG